MPIVVVAERIIPGVRPSYCAHAQATCMGGCNEWVWLGDKTRAKVRAGAEPLCVQCATVIINPEHAVFLDLVTDH